MHNGGDCEGSEELDRGVLEEADACVLAEAFEAWTVGRMGVDGNADTRDKGNGGEISRIRHTVQRQIALLLRGEGNHNIDIKETLVGVDQFAAGLGCLACTLRIDIDESHCPHRVAGGSRLAV